MQLVRPVTGRDKIYIGARSIKCQPDSPKIVSRKNRMQSERLLTEPTDLAKRDAISILDGLSVHLMTVTLIVPRSIREIIRSAPMISPQLKDSTYPLPPPGLRLHELGLRARTLRVLEKCGFAADLKKLGSLTVGQSLAFRGFGIGCAIDLAETLHRVSRMPRDQGIVPQNLREIVAGKPRRLTGLLHCRLPRIPDWCSLYDLESEPHTFNALDQAGYLNNPTQLTGLTLREALRFEGVGKHAVCDLVDAIYQAQTRRQSDATSKTLDELVLDRLVPGRSRRDRQMVALYFGLCGESRRTLASLGRECGLTKERVRQICWRRIGDLKQLRMTPVVRAVELALKHATPCLATVLDRRLAAEGLVHSATRITDVLCLLDAIGCNPAYAALGSPGHEILIAEPARQAAIKIQSVAVSAVRKLGCCQLPTVVDRLTRPWKAKPDSVVSILELAAGFQWLNRRGDWFWIHLPRPDRLRKRIREVLCVAPHIRLLDLRSALVSDPRLPFVPSRPILRDYCKAIPDCQIEGEWVVAREPLRPEDVLRGDELTLVKILLKDGPVLKAEDFRKLAVQAGVRGQSFRDCLRKRPTMSRYGKEMSGLIGADCPRRSKSDA
jgi:hypothetical protein